ncbi:Zinc finger MYND-type [Penicillium expansum]|nr:Zinc finger MYND-type [Penicillium expansum]
MAAFSDRWSMENGPPSPETINEVRATPETSRTSRYGASRRAATPRIADHRTPVIPPGYQQIPGYEAHRQRQEARALMGSIAERRVLRQPVDLPTLIKNPKYNPASSTAVLQTQRALGSLRQLRHRLIRQPPRPVSFLKKHKLDFNHGNTKAKQYENNSKLVAIKLATAATILITIDLVLQI